MKYSEKQVGYREIYRFHEYDSISDFNEYLNKAQPNRHFAGSSLSSQEIDYRFSGTHTYQEAEDLFKTGWNVVAEKLAKKLPIQTANAQTNRTKPTYGVVGSQASVPRYLQGIPTNMIDRKAVQQKQKIIVLNRDISFSASVGKEEIEEEGLKALQIIQLLENKGYRVKLNLFFLSNQDNENIAFRVTVKKPEERLSVLKIAFPLAHPAMLRRITFKWIETHPTMANRGYTFGYGRPEGASIRNLIDKDEYLLPNFIRNVDDYIKGLGL